MLWAMYIGRIFLGKVLSVSLPDQNIYHRLPAPPVEECCIESSVSTEVT